MFKKCKSAAVGKKPKIEDLATAGVFTVQRLCRHCSLSSPARCTLLCRHPAVTWARCKLLNSYHEILRLNRAVVFRGESRTWLDAGSRVRTIENTAPCSLVWTSISSFLSFLFSSQQQCCASSYTRSRFSSTISGSNFARSSRKYYLYTISRFHSVFEWSHLDTPNIFGLGFVGRFQRLWSSRAHCPVGAGCESMFSSIVRGFVALH